MARSRTRRIVRGLTLALGLLPVLCLLAEAGFRLVESSLGLEDQPLNAYRTWLLQGTPRGYESSAHTGFLRRRSTETTNSWGFSDVEWSPEKTAGVPRILCLGGSTTECGSTRAEHGRYPELLERTLEARTGRDVEVLNAGIAGWTSAEILGAWFLSLQDLAPDVVVFHEGVHDLEPRLWRGFLPDYTSWRVPLVGGEATNPLERLLITKSHLYLRLRLRREPMPDVTSATTAPGLEPEPLLAEERLPRATAAPFFRNVASIAASAQRQGATVVLVTMPFERALLDTPAGARAFGLEQNNDGLRELARSASYVLADAARVFAERHDELAPEFEDAVHLKKGGNQVKADVVAEALLAHGLSAPAR